MTKRKEPTRITIANLEREVRNLTQRCTELLSARDEAISRRLETTSQRDAHSRKAADLQNHVDNLREENQSLLAAIKYNDGYIARVKETDAHTAGEVS